MDELLTLLAATNDFISIEIETPGIELTQNMVVISSESYLDGLKLYTSDEGTLFLSKLICELISRTENEDFISFTLKTANNVIIRITLGKS